LVPQFARALPSLFHGEPGECEAGICGSDTGRPCGQCHLNPAGGGKLKAFGRQFKANGFKLKK
jgi:hypothetical protein